MIVNRRDRRTPCKNGDEYDAFTGWRRLMKYLTRPGTAAWIKRKYRRRIRREGRDEARRGAA